MMNFKIRTKNNLVENFTYQKENEWKGPFYFIQASDPQYGFYREGKRDYDEEIRRSKLAVAVAKKLDPKPKFFIVCGDMTHAYPFEEYRQEQVNLFMDIFSELEPEIPLLCVCGNHDVGNSPTPKAINAYRETYGDDYYSFWCGGIFCIVINSQYYEDSRYVLELAEEQDRWLDRCLEEVKKSDCKHALIFQHIPWFLKDPHEENEYFNIEPVVRRKMLDKFKQSGINTVFCGHYHRNAGGFDGKMEVVVTTAIGTQLGQDEPGMRLVKVYEDRICHEFHELENFPSKAIL